MQRQRVMVLPLWLALGASALIASPPNPARTVFYDFQVKLFPEQYRFENLATLRIENEGSERLSTVMVALPPYLRLRSVSEQGRPAKRFERHWETVQITLERPLDAGAERDITFDYEFEFHGEGNRLFQFNFNIEPGNSYALVNWYPTTRSILSYEDQLVEGDKAGFRMALDVPEGELGVTAGRLVSTSQSSGRSRSVWESRDLIPLSLFFVSAGYQSRTIRAGRDEVEFYLEKGQAASGLESLARVVASTVRSNTKRFGDLGIRRYRVIAYRASGAARGYPGVLLLPRFSGFFDGLNHSFEEGLLDRRLVVAHEVSHSWWGNAVTGVGPGGNTLLSEGFATYAALRAIGEISARSEEWRLVRAMRESLMQSEIEARPIVQVENLANVFTDEVYKRGALALYNLAYEIGEEHLSEILANFFRRFRGGFATVEDFQQVALELRPDLGGFFKQWFHSAQMPDIVVEGWKVERVNSGWVHRVTVKNRGTGRLTFPLVVSDNSSEVETRVSLEEGQQKVVEVVADMRGTSVTVDPLGRTLHGRRLGSILFEAERLRQSGRHQQASALYETLLQSDPENARVLYGMGRIHMLDDRFDAALDCFRRALSNYKGQPWIPVWSWIRLGQVHDLKGQRKLALEAYQKALDLGVDENNSLDVARRGLDKPFTKD